MYNKLLKYVNLLNLLICLLLCELNILLPQLCLYGMVFKSLTFLATCIWRDRFHFPKVKCAALVRQMLHFQHKVKETLRVVISSLASISYSYSVSLFYLKMSQRKSSFMISLNGLLKSKSLCYFLDLLFQGSFPSGYFVYHHPIPVQSL